MDSLSVLIFQQEKIANIFNIFCTNRPSLNSSYYALPGIRGQESVCLQSSTVVKLQHPVKQEFYFCS